MTWCMAFRWASPASPITRTHPATTLWRLASTGKIRRRCSPSPAENYRDRLFVRAGTCTIETCTTLLASRGHCQPPTGTVKCPLRGTTNPRDEHGCTPRSALCKRDHPIPVVSRADISADARLALLSQRRYYFFFFSVIAY